MIEGRESKFGICLTIDGTALRLSEKTIELNFCAQFVWGGARSHWWIGSTQWEEKRKGWDTRGLVGGRWMLFQIKASDKVLRSGVRQFQAQHHQMKALQKQASRLPPDSVFYVLPMLGTTQEIAVARFKLLPKLRFLDVTDIPRRIRAPNALHKPTLRVSRNHYIDVDPSGLFAIIHSKPVRVNLKGAERILGSREDAKPRFQNRQRSIVELGMAREFVRGGINRVALFIEHERI